MIYIPHAPSARSYQILGRNLSEPQPGCSLTSFCNVFFDPIRMLVKKLPDDFPIGF